jgi:hypothetical protein
MGSCFACCCITPNSTLEQPSAIVTNPRAIVNQIGQFCYTKIALKFPHGTNGVVYNEDQKRFECLEINEWIASLYGQTALPEGTSRKSWTHWIIYNDEHPPSSLEGCAMVRKGHCKGILAWNDTHMSWLVHSVPNFPRAFTGATISEIEPSERIYGQSFIYVTRPADEAFIQQVINQLYHMEANIYIAHNYKVDHGVHYVPHDLMSTIVFSDTIQHIAKSPKYEFDIYSDFLIQYDVEWHVQTWKRGHLFKVSPYIKDVASVNIRGAEYKDSQDHAKWAISKRYYWIGDLNRMVSQIKRGGGGFLVKQKEIAEALRRCIVSVE